MKTNYYFCDKPILLWNNEAYDVEGELMGRIYTSRDDIMSIYGSKCSGPVKYDEKATDVWFGIPTPKAQAEMTEYLKTHKVDSYFPAHAARLHNNHFVLMEVAEEVKKQGFTCYCAKDRYDCKTTEFVYAIRGDECVLFGFKEVPYQWYIYSTHYPGLTSGLIKFSSYDYPFDMDDILSQVGPNRFKEGYFDSPYYQKL